MEENTKKKRIIKISYLQDDAAQSSALEKTGKIGRSTADNAGSLLKRKLDEIDVSSSDSNESLSSSKAKKQKKEEDDTRHNAQENKADLDSFKRKLYEKEIETSKNIEPLSDNADIQNRQKKRIIKISYLQDNPTESNIQEKIDDIGVGSIDNSISNLTKNKLDNAETASSEIKKACSKRVADKLETSLTQQKSPQEKDTCLSSKQTIEENLPSKTDAPGSSESQKPYRKTEEQKDAASSSKQNVVEGLTQKEKAETEIVEIVDEDTGRRRKIFLVAKKGTSYGIDWSKYFVKKEPSVPEITPSTSKSTPASSCTKSSTEKDSPTKSSEASSSTTKELTNKNTQKTKKKDKRIRKTKVDTRPKLQTVSKIKNDVINQIQIKMETTEQAVGPNDDISVKKDALMQYFEKGKLSYRVMRRANFIINMVKQDKVIVDMMKLVKAIREEEVKEGYNVAIDKKSLLRLILKLSQFGLIKFRKVTLKSETLEKCICFICHVKIDDEHAVITSALEQCKMKFFMTRERRDDNCVIEEKDIPKHSKNMVQSYSYVTDKDFVSLEKPPAKYRNSRIGKKYGLVPKFLRDRFLHELLYYLIYEDFPEAVNNQGEIENVFQEFGGSSTIFENDNFFTIYNRELSWKMFIPPLPQHQGWPKGWIFISDLLLRLPLFIFVRIINITYEVPNIEYYLTHPVRQYFLVKNLPPVIRNCLMGDRKFVYNIVESLKRLCFMGLTQFGPQKLKEKDQVFIYLNRKASLYNTVTSPPGYLKVSDDLQYEKTQYTFKTVQDLEQYWHDMWFICMNTSLGHRSTVAGETVVLEQPIVKPDLIATLKARVATEAEEHDTGEIPGDRKGAAGLDSSLFAHLKRSWNWTNIIPINTKNLKISEVGNKQNESSEVAKQVAPEKTEQDKVANDKEKNDVPVKENKESKSPEGKIKKEIKETKTKPKKIKQKAKMYEGRRKRIVRLVKPPKKHKPKIWYDEKDQICLRKMSKLRTDWSPLEDHFILLFTVASIYLCANPRRQKVDCTIMRDLLHKMVPYSHDKTSRAVQRRKAYIMKNIKTRKSVLTCLEEIQQCDYITEKFGPLTKKHQTSVMPVSTLNIAFVEMIGYLNHRFSSQKRPKNSTPTELPDTLEEIKNKYDYNIGPKKITSTYSDVETIHDIHFDVVRSVVHSSLCSSKDKTSWAIQLFKIYHQYPESLLRQVVLKIRHSQMVSLKKVFKLRNSGSIIQTPLKLSINYANQLRNTKFNFDSFTEAASFLQNVGHWLQEIREENLHNLDITCSDHGTSMIIIDIVEKLNADFIFNHPDQVIILDPVLQSDKTYERIVKKYYDILKDVSTVSTWEETKSTDNNSDSEDDNFPHIENEQLIDLNTVCRRPSTRLAFHMMRADMSEGNKNLQHMHDFFVVQASKVYLSIPESVKIDLFEKQFKNVSKPVIDQIKSESIVPDFYKKIISDDVRSYFKNMNLTLPDFEYIEKIKCHIWTGNEFGITIDELKSIKADSNGVTLSLKNVLDFLKAQSIVLQVGVSVIRYVHYEFKKPWLVHTDKLLRTDREKIDTKNITPSRWKGKAIPKDNEGKEQKKIKVLMAPWIRIDGSINRRVLDRWMSCFISTFIEEPGIKLSDLLLRITYLKPVEVSFLVEQLVKINCIRLVKVKKPKVTLFSKEENYTFEETDILDDAKEICIEPTENILLNFAAFIGAKSYNANFMD